MGRYQPGINHTARCVDQLLARLGIKLADLRNSPFDNANCAARPHRRAGETGENSLGALDQEGGHESAPTSLSCHAPSATLERATISVNRPTPASVMSNMAANMRGMSSAKPACMIS